MRVKILEDIRVLEKRDHGPAAVERPERQGPAARPDCRYYPGPSRAARRLPHYAACVSAVKGMLFVSPAVAIGFLACHFVAAAILFVQSFQLTGWTHAYQGFIGRGVLTAAPFGAGSRSAAQ